MTYLHAVCRLSRRHAPYHRHYRCGSVFIGQMSLSSRAILSGLERMEFVSLSDIAAKGVATLLSIVLLVLGYGVTAVAFVSILGSSVGLVTQLAALRRIGQLHFKRF
jgi:O-antigen/teichoic acid export membrane protein